MLELSANSRLCIKDKFLLTYVFSTVNTLYSVHYTEYRPDWRNFSGQTSNELKPKSEGEFENNDYIWKLCKTTVQKSWTGK